MLDATVDRLSILVSIAPPNFCSNPLIKASVISFAPSAVFPKVATWSFVKPSSAFNIPSTSIPLSMTMFNSSRPKPPEADLCTVLTSASKTPNWSVDVDAVSANTCNILLVGSTPADCKEINAFVTVSIWKGVVCAKFKTLCMASEPASTLPNTVFKESAKSSNSEPTFAIFDIATPIATKPTVAAIKGPFILANLPPIPPAPIPKAAPPAVPVTLIFPSSFFNWLCNCLVSALISITSWSIVVPVAISQGLTP